jgi:hypothetical protein
MTQRIFIDTNDAALARTRHEPWWIPFGETVATVWGALSGPREARTSELPREVLRDYDPALHRALTDRVDDRGLDSRSRPLFY